VVQRAHSEARAPRKLAHLQQHGLVPVGKHAGPLHTAPGLRHAGRGARVRAAVL
jgi:hypothetical protein